MKVKIIGAGLAGCEAAYQLAKRGIYVDLYDMKPDKKSPAHNLDTFAELVCSNSLKSDLLSTSSGLLKKELELLDCFILKVAYQSKIPAGGALAVDRKLFSDKITDYLKSNKYINIINEEVTKIDKLNYTIIATGPLSSLGISEEIKKITANDDLYFFDAASPIVNYDSIDMNIAYKKSRYDKGDADYINCSMSKKEYDEFYKFLITGESIDLKDFENKKVFESCMPIEVMAKRGYETLTYGPLKPVGLDKNAYAVVQLRQDNKLGSLYNLVGFQTNLKFQEQKKLLKLIPGLKNVSIEKYGVMHRNTYINSPNHLNQYSQLKKYENVFIAGQLSGVEGYVESIMSGLISAINIYKLINNEKMVLYSQETMTGALLEYISNTYNSNFQPMNSNFGILKPLDRRIKNKKERKLEYSKRAIICLEETIKAYFL